MTVSLVLSDSEGTREGFAQDLVTVTPFLTRRNMLEQLGLKRKKVGTVSQHIVQKNGDLVVILPEQLVQELNWKEGMRLLLIPTDEYKKLLLEKAPPIKKVIPINLNPAIKKFFYILFLMTLFLVFYSNGFSPWFMFTWALILLGATIILKK